MSNPSYSLMVLRAIGFVVWTAGGLVLARPVGGQLTSAIDLSSRSAQPSSDGWESRLAVSPFVRFDHPRVSVDGRWTAVGGNGQRLSGFGNLNATYFSPTRAGLELSVGGFADRALLNETFALSRIGTDARLSYRAGASGAWLGREVSRDDKPTPISPVPRYSAGGWRQLGNALVTVSVSSFGSREGARAGGTHTETRPTLSGPLAPPVLDTGGRVGVRTLDTITVVDSGSAGRRRNWRDAELALHWSAWRLAFQGVVGTRFAVTNQPNETWGQVRASLDVAPDIALIAASGVHPSSAAYGLSRARFIELGFRIAPTALRRPRLPAGVRPAAAAFAVEDAANGQRTLRIRIADARSVELSGDFTNWKPVALKRADADQWQATLAISPGMHRLVIRVNGEAWTVPPGLVAIQDEFQGTVGVIIVR